MTSGWYGKHHTTPAGCLQPVRLWKNSLCVKFSPSTDGCFNLKGFLKDVILMSARLTPEILYFFLLNDEVGTWTPRIDF